jgi:hypothetical protein
MKDEPRRHPGYLALLAIVSLGTVPVLFVGSESEGWLGLPAWLWSSMAFTLALSALTAFGILRLWKDDDDA